MEPVPSTDAALATINERHGASWQLVRRLAGGHTVAGAHESGGSPPIHCKRATLADWMRGLGRAR